MFVFTISPVAKFATILVFVGGSLVAAAMNNESLAEKMLIAAGCLAIPVAERRQPRPGQKNGARADRELDDESRRG